MLRLLFYAAAQTRASLSLLTVSWLRLTFSDSRTAVPESLATVRGLVSYLPVGVVWSLARSLKTYQLYSS
jgi:hypothetical protein